MSTTFLLIPPSSSFLLLPPPLSSSTASSKSQWALPGLNRELRFRYVKSQEITRRFSLKLVLNERSLFVLVVAGVACSSKINRVQCVLCLLGISVFHIFPFASFLSLFSEPFFLHLSGESGDASGFYVNTSSRSVASIRSTPLHFSVPPP